MNEVHRRIDPLRRRALQSGRHGVQERPELSADELCAPAGVCEIGAEGIRQVRVRVVNGRDDRQERVGEAELERKRISIDGPATYV